MGALVAPVGYCRMDFPDAGYRAGFLLGLLRIGLGRLVVLGPSRKRILPALAGGYCADPFAGCDRKAWTVPQLDHRVGHHRVFAEPVGDVPRALRRIDVGACFCSRPAPRCVHSGVLVRGGRRFADAVCIARQQGTRGWCICVGVARDLPAGQQCAADGCRGRSAAGYAVPADHRCAESGQAVGRPALLQCGVRAHHDAGAGVHGAGLLVALEGRYGG